MIAAQILQLAFIVGYVADAARDSHSDLTIESWAAANFATAWSLSLRLQMCPVELAGVRNGVLSFQECIVLLVGEQLRRSTTNGIPGTQ